MRIAILVTGLWLLSSACTQVTPPQHTRKVLLVQPFSDCNPTLTATIYEQIRQIYPSTILRPPIELPRQAWHAARNRYKADTLIRYLGQPYGADTVVIGLTHYDISTSSKKGHQDWGVMGLGYCPGNACVASTFRLKRNKVPDQFYKVAIHELGHTQGLPHCPDTTCFMRDAKGGNPIDEEKHFCQACRQHLVKKGWQLL